MSEEEKTPSLEDTAGDDTVGSRNPFSDIERAFATIPDGDGDCVIRQKASATPEEVEKATKALKEMGWSSAPSTVKETDKDGKETDLLVFSPKSAAGLSDGDARIVDSFTSYMYEKTGSIYSKEEVAPTPEAKSDMVAEEALEQQAKERLSDIEEAFSIEQNEKGDLFLRQNPKASPEAVAKGEKALGEMGWTSAATTEKGKDGKDLVTYKPTTDKESGFLADFYVYEETGHINGGLAAGKSATLIGGAGAGKSATVVGGAGAGQNTGVISSNKLGNGNPTLTVGTDYGEGKDIYENRVSKESKPLPEWITPNSETMGDFFVDSFVETTRWINQIVKVIRSWRLTDDMNESAERARTARDEILDKDANHPGLISKLVTQIQNGDVQNVETTLETMRKLIERTDDRNLDKKSALKSLDKIGAAIEAEKANLSNPACTYAGKRLVNSIAQERENLAVAVANKRKIMSVPTATKNAPPISSYTRGGRGAHTP